MDGRVARPVAVVCSVASVCVFLIKKKLINYLKKGLTIALRLLALIAMIQFCYLSLIPFDLKRIYVNSRCNDARYLIPENLIIFRLHTYSYCLRSGTRIAKNLNCFSFQVCPIRSPLVYKSRPVVQQPSL